MHDLVLQLLNGLVVGSSLALVASGLALVFGVLDIVNFAQGELFMLGGYVLYFVDTFTGNFVLGVLAAALLIGVLGGGLLYGMVWPLLGRSQALPLLATLGLSLILQQLATNVFNSTTRSVPAPIDLRIPIENVDYPVYNILIIAISAGILAAGYLFLRSTRYGIWLRAVAENRPMAAALGVPVPRVYLLAFMLSAGLAGIAGALLAPVVSVYTTVGQDVILNAFIVVVAGGMGNFRGAAMVAILLGEVEAVGSIWFRPVEVQVFALFLVIAILIYRSRGKAAPMLYRAPTVVARGASATLMRNAYIGTEHRRADNHPHRAAAQRQRLPTPRHLSDLRTARRLGGADHRFRAAVQHRCGRHFRFERLRGRVPDQPRHDQSDRADAGRVRRRAAHVLAVRRVYERRLRHRIHDADVSHRVSHGRHSVGGAANHRR